MKICGLRLGVGSRGNISIQNALFAYSESVGKFVARVADFDFGLLFEYEKRFFQSFSVANFITLQVPIIGILKLRATVCLFFVVLN